MKNSATIGVVMVLCLAFASATWAGPTLLSDNFNNETPGTVADLTQWNVIDGSIDVIGEGTAWDLFPGKGYGLYVDMDGDEGGTIVSKESFDLKPGTYALRFDLAGANRELATGEDSVTVVVADKEDLVKNIYTFGKWVPFTKCTEEFTVTSETTVTVSFAGSGSDTRGMLLDNVSLARIPAPGAIVLGSLGVGLVGWLRRRRTL